MLAREVRAAAYHCRALEESDLAAASILDRVREKHEAAAARWRELAAMNEGDGPMVARLAPRNREDIPCIS
jgi:hypothetical protein